jgi:HSP20 family protein
MRDFAQVERTLFEPFLSGSEEMLSSSWVPSVDVAEDGEQVVVRAEVPGMNPDDIDIRFADGRLTLSGERKQENETDGRTWHRVERSYGRFTRTFMLPTSVDADKAIASFANGILEVVMPKREEAKPKRIEVKRAESASESRNLAA